MLATMSLGPQLASSLLSGKSSSLRPLHSAPDLQPQAGLNHQQQNTQAQATEGVGGAEGQYKAKRYAVKFDPPCVFLEYEDATAKRRVRAVKINKLTSTVDPDKLTRKVIRSFPRKLDLSTVKFDQVRKLVVKLIQHAALQPSSEASAGPGSLQVGVGKNALDNLGLGSPMPSVSPKLPAGVRDKVVYNDTNRGSMESVDRFSTSTNSDKADDELDSALKELDVQLGTATRPSSGLLASDDSLSPIAMSRDASFTFTDRPATIGTAGPASTSRPSEPAKSRFAQEARSRQEDRLVLDMDISGDLDLNKVTEVELQLAKQKMEQDFVKNQLKPGDPGYEYDKQVEFTGATEPNDWDDSDDDEAEADASSPTDVPAAVDWEDITKTISKT